MDTFHCELINSDHIYISCILNVLTLKGSLDTYNTFFHDLENCSMLNTTDFVVTSKTNKLATSKLATLLLAIR